MREEDIIGSISSKEKNIINEILKKPLVKSDDELHISLMEERKNGRPTLLPKDFRQELNDMLKSMDEDD